MQEIRELTQANFTLFFGGDKTKCGEFEKFAGLPVTMTESGQIIGYGHLDVSDFLPAAIHLYLTEGDAECNETELLALGEKVVHTWALLSSYTDAEEWEVTTEKVGAQTRHAFPVTVLEV